MAAATREPDDSARRSRSAAAALLTVALLLGAGLAFRTVGPQAGDNAGYQIFLDRSGEPSVYAEINQKSGPISATVATAGIRGTILALPAGTAQDLMSALGGLYADPDLQVERSYSSQVQPDGSILTTTVLALLTPEHYATGVITGSLGTSLTYSPPRTELPADAVPGVTWASEGVMNNDNPFSLRGAIAAAEARGDRRCIKVETVLEQRSPRARPSTRTTTSTWCEGLGAVDSNDLGSGTLFRRTTPGSVSLSPVQAPSPEPLPVGIAVPGPFPNSDIAQQPVVMGGLVISTMDATGDLRAVHPTPGGQQVVWVQHPGGEILGMTADESLLYVTTAKRLLLTFDAAGRVHWLARLPEAAAGAPALAGDVVAVSLLDGTTHGYDRRDGRQLWSIRLTDTVTAPPVASGDLVVSADVSGLVEATHADGNAAWSASVGPVRVPMTALPDGGVLVVDSEDSLHAFDGAGTLHWAAELGEPVTAGGAVLGGVVALPVDGGIVGLRLADGSTAWRLEIPGLPVIDAAGRLASGSTTGLLTPNGELTDKVDVAGEGTDNRRRTWPVTVGGQHLLLESSGALTATGDG